MRVKSETRRQAILAAAAEVFSELGFEQASMSEISLRVGGSKKTLYSYFESKEELFLEVMINFAKLQMQKIDAVMDPGKDLRTTLLRYGECLLDMISSPKMIPVLRVAYAQAAHGKASRQFYERGLQEALNDLSAYMAACQQLGKLPAGNPMLLAQYLIAMLRAETLEPLLMGAYQNAELPPTSEVAERAVHLFLRAFAPPSA